MHLGAVLVDTAAVVVAAADVALVAVGIVEDAPVVDDVVVDVGAAAEVLILDDAAVAVAAAPYIHLARCPVETTSPLLLPSHSHHSTVTGVAAGAGLVVGEGGRWSAVAVAAAAAAVAYWISAEVHPGSGCLKCHYSIHFPPARTALVVFVVAAAPAAADDWAWPVVHRVYRRPRGRCSIRLPAAVAADEMEQTSA